MHFDSGKCLTSAFKQNEKQKYSPCPRRHVMTGDAYCGGDEAVWFGRAIGDDSHNVRKWHYRWEYTEVAEIEIFAQLSINTVKK